MSAGASHAVVAACALTITGAASAGPMDVLYVHGTHPPALDGETLRLDDTSNLGYSGFRDALNGAGFSLTEFAAGPGSSARLDAPGFLDSYQVLILSSNNRVFTTSEAAAVDTWVRGGGGIVAFSDAAFGRDQDGDGNNDPNSVSNNTGIPNTIGRDSDNALTAQFGLFFLRDTGGQWIVGQDQADYQFDHPIWQNNAAPDGAIQFKGEGVSPISVSGDAEVLFAYQDAQRPNGNNPTGLTSGDSGEGFVLDETIAAIAIAETGLGKVVGTFDRNTFWNNGPGSDINEFDNRQFAVNLVEWAASGGQVNFDENDLAAVLNGWGNTASGGDRAAGELTGEGSVGIDDLERALARWSPAATSTVPEPTTLAVLLGGVCVGLGRRRR